MPRGLNEVEYYRYLKSHMTWNEFMNAKMDEESEGSKDGDFKFGGKETPTYVTEYLQKHRSFRGNSAKE